MSSNGKDGVAQASGQLLDHGWMAYRKVAWIREMPGSILSKSLLDLVFILELLFTLACATPSDYDSESSHPSECELVDNLMSCRSRLTLVQLVNLDR